MIPNKGDKVYGRKGTDFAKIAGIATGTTTECTLTCCSGTRVFVKWPDGKITKPCSKGIVKARGGYRID